MFSLRLWLILAAFVAGGYFSLHSPEVAAWVTKVVSQVKTVLSLIQQNLPAK